MDAEKLLELPPGRCIVTEHAPELRGAPDVSGRPTLREKVAAFERSVILESFAENSWKKSRVAKVLGLSRPGLDKKVRRYGIKLAKGGAGKVAVGR